MSGRRAILNGASVTGSIDRHDAPSRQRVMVENKAREDARSRHQRLLDAACLAQVHAHVLTDGRHVCVWMLKCSIAVSLDVS